MRGNGRTDGRVSYIEPKENGRRISFVLLWLFYVNYFPFAIGETQSGYGLLTSHFLHYKSGTLEIKIIQINTKISLKGPTFSCHLHIVLSRTNLILVSLQNS